MVLEVNERSILLILSILHTISIIYMLLSINIMQKKMKLLDKLENDMKMKKKKMSIIKKYNGIVAKYIKECQRHCTGKVLKYDNDNYRVYIEFFDYRQPYTIDIINKLDPDNGWYSCLDVEIEEDVRDIKYMNMISENEFNKLKNMLDSKNVLCLLKVQTIYNDIYYIVTKCKTQLKILIRNMIYEDEKYYKMIKPLLVENAKLLDEAETNMICAFNIRFEDNIDNDIRAFIGVEKEIMEEFMNFFENHPEYKKND